MAAPTSTTKPDHGWPTASVRRALSCIAFGCAVVVVALGVRVASTTLDLHHTPVPAERILGIPFDMTPLSDLIGPHGKRLLVFFGDPKIFGLCLMALAVVSWLKRDRRLSLLCIGAPVAAEILTQLVAKPGFDRRVAPEIYSYPSGHVTATAAIMMMTFVCIQRLASPRWAWTSAPVLAMLAGASMVGVVVNDMHDFIDAVGGLAMGIGVVSLGAALVLRPLDR